MFMQSAAVSMSWSETKHAFGVLRETQSLQVVLPQYLVAQHKFLDHLICAYGMSSSEAYLHDN